jgi:hypothetical protein
MSHDHDRIRRLVALACDQHTTEEGRTAAVQACRLITKAGLLDRLLAPSRGAPSTWVSMSEDPLIQQIIRDSEARAVERAERMLRSTEGHAWLKRVCYRRSFCRLCRGFIEEGAVMFSSSFGDRCLACDERAEAIAKAAEERRTPPPPAAPKPRKRKTTKLGDTPKEG